MSPALQDEVFPPGHQGTPEQLSFLTELGPWGYSCEQGDQGLCPHFVASVLDRGRRCSPSLSWFGGSLWAPLFNRLPSLFAFQLQGLSHNVIFTLDSLLKGDLKGVKGVSVPIFDFHFSFKGSICFVFEDPSGTRI